jgi:predicted RNA-binding Zn ribbon-like protein
MTAVETSPWFVYPPAVDLANTVAPGAPDQLADARAAERFVAVERGRIPGVELVAQRLEDARAVRTTVRALLAARVAGDPLPATETAQVNAWSAAAPTHPVLDAGAARHVDGGRTPWDSFRAAVARSVIELAGDPESGVRVCPAPGCGMFYVRAHPRQEWCSPACGNRGRVARHAARSRRAPA